MPARHTVHERERRLHHQHSLAVQRLASRQTRLAQQHRLVRRVHRVHECRLRLARRYRSSRPRVVLCYRRLRLREPRAPEVRSAPAYRNDRRRSGRERRERFERSRLSAAQQTHPGLSDRRGVDDDVHLRDRGERFVLTDRRHVPAERRARLRREFLRPVERAVREQHRAVAHLPREHESRRATCAPGAQQQHAFARERRQKRRRLPRKRTRHARDQPVGVRVVAGEPAVRAEGERVDGADLARDGVDLVEQRHDGQLVRHGDVGAHKAGILAKGRHERLQVLRTDVKRRMVRVEADVMERGVPHRGAARILRGRLAHRAGQQRARSGLRRQRIVEAALQVV